MEENDENLVGRTGDIASEIRTCSPPRIQIGHVTASLTIMHRNRHNRRRHWSLLVQAVVVREQAYFGGC